MMIENETCEICNQVCNPGDDIQLEGSLKIKHLVHTVCVKNAETVAKWYNGGSYWGNGDIMDARLKLSHVNGDIKKIHDFLVSGHWFDNHDD